MAAGAIAGAIASLVVFGFLQILVTIGVFPAVFRLDPAAVDMSKAVLDFLPKIAWPVAFLVVVLCHGRLSSVWSGA